MKNNFTRSSSLGSCSIMVVNKMEFDSTFQNNFFKKLNSHLANTEDLATSFLTNYKFPDYRKGCDLSRNGFFKTNSETITRKKDSPEVELERRSSKCQVQEHESAKCKFTNLVRKIDVKRDTVRRHDVVQHHEETSETNIITLEKHTKTMPTKIVLSVAKQLKRITGGKNKKLENTDSSDSEQKESDYVKDEINRDGVMSIFIQENHNGTNSPFIKKSDLDVDRSSKKSKSSNDARNSRRKRLKKILYSKLLLPRDFFLFLKRKKDETVAERNPVIATATDSGQVVKMNDIQNHDASSMETFQLPISINSLLNEEIGDSNSLVQDRTVKNNIGEVGSTERPVKKLYILKYMFSKKKPPGEAVEV